MTMTLMSLKAVGLMQVRCCIKAQLNSSHPCCAEGALVVLETIRVHWDDSEANKTRSDHPGYPRYNSSDSAAGIFPAGILFEMHGRKYHSMSLAVLFCASCSMEVSSIRMIETY